MATKTPIKKRPPKTLKERRFVKELQTSASITEAAVRAGYGTNRLSARNIGSEVLAKLGIDQVMDKAGLTDEVLVSSLTMGLMDANKTDQYTGEHTPDYGTRHRYLETAFKLKNYLNSDKSGDTYNQGVIFQISRDT